MSHKYTEFSRNINSIASGIGVNNTSYLNFISWCTFCWSMYWIADNYVWTELRADGEVTNKNTIFSKINGNGQVNVWDATCIVTSTVEKTFSILIFCIDFLNILYYLNWNVITIFRMMAFMNGIRMLRFQINWFRSRQ